MMQENGKRQVDPDWLTFKVKWDNFKESLTDSERDIYTGFYLKPNAYWIQVHVGDTC